MRMACVQTNRINAVLADDVWSYKASYLMPTFMFREYMCFVRKFVTHLTAKYYTEGCPFAKVGEDGRCEAYFLERLVNWWAYNSGARMVFMKKMVRDDHVPFLATNRNVLVYEACPRQWHKHSLPSLTWGARAENVHRKR